MARKAKRAKPERPKPMPMAVPTKASTEAVLSEFYGTGLRDLREQIADLAASTRGQTNATFARELFEIRTLVSASPGETTRDAVNRFRDEAVLNRPLNANATRREICDKRIDATRKRDGDDQLAAALAAIETIVRHQQASA